MVLTGPPIPRRLLVVDDEEHLRFLLARALTRRGYEVFLADDGAEALTQLARIDVDAVISDVTMPTMTGIELAYRVLSSYPSLPLLFLTASDVPSDLLAEPLIRLLQNPATILAVTHQLEELTGPAALPGVDEGRRRPVVNHPAAGADPLDTDRH